MRPAVWGAAAACMFGATGAHAETQYVIEQLVVNVSSAPDGGSRVASIHSGDSVELLDRRNGQALVRLTSGAKGWVKSTYLTPDPPLHQRLDERTQALEQSRKRVEQLESELAQARLAAERPASIPPSSAASGPSPDRGAAEKAHTEQTAQPSTHTVFPDANPYGRPTWKWVVGSSAVCLFAGFTFGWRALDRKIRRKYGGLRIY